MKIQIALPKHREVPINIQIFSLLSFYFLGSFNIGFQKPNDDSDVNTYLVFQLNYDEKS